MPRPKNTGERQRQIVEGLLRVMSERGYERASVQAIARAAGLSPSLVHYHFKNKQQVLLALIGRLGEIIGARFEARASRAADPWQRLDAFIDAHLALDETADPAAVACWVAIGAEAVRQPEVRAVYQETVQNELALLASLVGDVLAHESRAEEAAGSIAAGLFAAIQGSYQLAAVTRAAPEGFAAPTVRQMARGLIHGSQKAGSAP